MTDEGKMNKLKRIIEKEINPYPYSYKDREEISKIISNFEGYEGKDSRIAGRIIGMRRMGSLFFMYILDGEVDWANFLPVVFNPFLQPFCVCPSEVPPCSSLYNVPRRLFIPRDLPFAPVGNDENCPSSFPVYDISGSE